jgi:Domain of unknown function DUF120
MPKAFEGMVSSRSSTSAAGPPGEQVILELNPERREKLLELTFWRSLYPGTLNLEVDDAVLELLRDSETVWVEDAHEVRYPDSWQHIPKLRKAYLYYQGTARSAGFSIDVLIRRAENPVPGRVELFAPESIRRSLNINDGDRITIELDDSGEMLQNMKQDWREQHRFFSNQGKEDRERWVVGASLPASWSTDWVTLSPCGWRSVSCLIKNEALMLFATDSAPAFLRGS